MPSTSGRGGRRHTAGLGTPSAGIGNGGMASLGVTEENFSALRASAGGSVEEMGVVGSETSDSPAGSRSEYLFVGQGVKAPVLFNMHLGVSYSFAFGRG